MAERINDAAKITATNTQYVTTTAQGRSVFMLEFIYLY